MITEGQDYFTCMIPAVPSDKHPGELHEGRTPWHPTELTGKWSILSRGAFPTVTDAIEWARAKLNGLPYTIVRVTLEGMFNLNGTQYVSAFDPEYTQLLIKKIDAA